MSRLGTAVTSAIAIGIGLITLIGLLTGDSVGVLATVTGLLLQIAVITVAVTALIGILNLLSVHIGRIGRRSGGWGYSLFLVLSAVLVILLAIMERLNLLGTQPSPSSILLESVQLSIESALAALLLFALVHGAIRIMRRQISGAGLLFTLALLVLLLGALPLPGLSLVASVRDWLLAVPVSAGARGILLGIALATVVTGVRVLIGQERSYRE